MNWLLLASWLGLLWYLDTSQSLEYEATKCQFSLSSAWNLPAVCNFHALSRFSFALLSLRKLRDVLVVYLNTIFHALSRISFALPNLRKLRELLAVNLNTIFHALSRFWFALLSLRKLRELLVVYLNTIFHALLCFSSALLSLRKLREVHLVYLNARVTVYSRYRDQPYLEKRSETGYPARVYYEIPRDRFRKIKLDSSGSLRWTILKQNKTTCNSQGRSNIGANSLESVVPSHFHRETTCITELWSVTLREKRAITKYLPNMTFSLAVCCFIFLLTKFSCCWASLFFGSILSTSSKSFFARSSSLIDNLAW